MKTSISVVIVNFNNLVFLRRCLESVVRSSLQNYEIIVVDNASTEPGIDEAMAAFPDARLVQLPTNIGFAGGSNTGIRQAKGDFIFLLNNDAALIGQNWNSVEEYFQQDEKLAGLQPKIVILDEPLINNCGLQLNFLGFSWNNHYRQPTDSIVGGEQLAAFSGAAVILRRSALERVGLFDDHYFMYHEDVDLSCRLRLNGWTIRSEPQLVVSHQYSYKRAPERFYYLERNRLRTMLKSFPLALLLAALPAFVFMEVGIMYYSLANHWFWQKIRSSIDVFFSLPYLLRDRFRQPRRISVREFTRPLVANVTFEEIQHPLLGRIANPVLAAYRRLLKVIFAW